MGERTKVRSAGLILAGIAIGSVPVGAKPAAGTTVPEVAFETEAESSESVAASETSQFSWRLGLEAKTHYRDSEQFAFASPFPFPPEDLPVGATKAFLETVNSGDHLEISTLTLTFDAAWAENLTARAKVDVIDLYDRNPTSNDRKIDVDELWLRFGSDPGKLSERLALYLKVGKFGKFERQNDRHLESYGLCATAFNRFEDQGLELGADFGPYVFLRLSATQGNPLFFRDPNALAGDNGTPSRSLAVENPNPPLKSGILILYDAEVEDLDFDGDLELGAGLGLRFGDPRARRGAELLFWGYRRTLAETVPLDGTFYGGDLDLLDGPDGISGLPVTSDRKEEIGGNLWLYLGGFSLFGQYVDQELGGMPRTGSEAEVAWSFELPLVWAVAERQLFPTLQPVLRFSRLEPEFAGGSPRFPAPSVRWEWDKTDYGLRLGIVSGIDLTLEYADNEMTLANGAKVSEDEFLATLRWRQ